MIFRDDRPPEQKGWCIVLMTDAFMSGWGGAEGGPSYAGWPFPDGEESRVEAWVSSRSEARRVRIVLPTYRPRSGPGHCHIYAYSGQGR